MSILAPYFKIETFGAVDGPGVRLVVFLQGCPMRCLYCHNPESWAISNEKKISVDEVINLYLKNQSFYRNGGITLSGGEPLIHQDFCLNLADVCNKKNINLALDTSGSTFSKKNLPFYEKLSSHHPLWIIDIKHINPAKHFALTSIKEQNELELIKFLDKKHESYWIRQVLLRGYTDEKDDLIALGKFIKTLKYLTNFELLPYHTLGVEKYQSLKIPYKLKGVKDSTVKDVHNAESIILAVGKK